MPESGLLQWAVQIGGPLGACLVIFGYFYRKDMKENAERYAAAMKSQTEQYREDMRFYTDQMKQVSDEWKGQSALLIGIVKENTVAFTQNTQVVQSFHRHITEGSQRFNERDKN